VVLTRLFALNNINEGYNLYLTQQPFATSSSYTRPHYELHPVHKSRAWP